MMIALTLACTQALPLPVPHRETRTVTYTVVEPAPIDTAGEPEPVDEQCWGSAPYVSELAPVVNVPAGPYRGQLAWLGNQPPGDARVCAAWCDDPGPPWEGWEVGTWIGLDEPMPHLLPDTEAVDTPWTVNVAPGVAGLQTDCHLWVGGDETITTHVVVGL